MTAPPTPPDAGTPNPHLPLTIVLRHHEGLVLDDVQARLKASEAGQAAYAFARRERFIRREDRVFLTRVSGPHAESTTP